MNANYQRLNEIADEIGAIYHTETFGPQWVEELITSRFPNPRGSDPLTREGMANAVRNAVFEETRKLAKDNALLRGEVTELEHDNARLRDRLLEFED